MTLRWQKRDLAANDGAGADVGAPGPLPRELLGRAADALADLSWTAPTLGLRGYGFVVAPPPPPPVPPQIDLLWAELALQGAGLFEAYQAVVTAAAEADVTTRIIVARAQSWRRTDPTLVTMAAALGLTDADVDALFRSAEQLAKAAGVPVA